jgi:hypothetical protein
MRFHACFLILLGAAGISRAALFTNSFSADSFVRSNAPTSNYGGAGALSVSGATATNTSGVAMGIADTFIKFNTTAMVTNFNSLFGTSNWVINGATLVVTEVGIPNNPVFDLGKGVFEIDWISNDNWTEGTGTPAAPTSTNIVYTNELTLLTNVASLGIFTNTAANSTNTYSLPLAAPFVANLSAGGDVSLYLIAIDPTTGFTFDSRSFTTASERPFVVISAVPLPAISGITVSGLDVMISGTHGVAGSTYILSSGTNVASPLNQWNPIATNVLTSSGDFTITATNAAAINSSQQFFILQTQ